MPRNVDDIIKKLPAGRRKRVNARAAKLIAEEMTRGQLRVALRLTQVKVAKALGINQDSVSRLEQRTDVLVSTLRGYIEALGGELLIVAEFPDHAPIRLSGFTVDEPEPHRPKNRRPAKAFA